MKLPLVLALALTSWLALPALAGESKSPDILGTWVAEYQTHLHNGLGTSKQTLIIEKQYPEGFRGVREWTSTKFYPTKKGEELKTKTNKVAFAGVFGFNNRTLYFADHGQTSHIVAKLTGKNTMQVIFLKTGDPAVAFRATFKRVKQ